MSDSTAFLSGCAVAGVATLLWLQGGSGFEKPNLSYPNSSPYGNTSLADPSATNPNFPTPNNWSIDPKLKQQLEQQHAQFEQLKVELEKQKADNQQLQNELAQQRMEKEQLIAQLQQQENSLTNPSQNSKLQIGMIWALGGIIIILVVGGSFMMIGIVALLLRPQKNHAPRPTHIVHPLSLPTEYGYPGYQGDVVYHQPRLRKVKEIDREEA